MEHLIIALVKQGHDFSSCFPDFPLTLDNGISTLVY
jgi:hypothetical protein